MVQLLTNDSIPSRMWQKQLEICSMDTTSGSVPTLEVRKLFPFLQSLMILTIIFCFKQVILYTWVSTLPLPALTVFQKSAWWVVHYCHHPDTAMLTWHVTTAYIIHRYIKHTHTYTIYSSMVEKKKTHKVSLSFLPFLCFCVFTQLGQFISQKEGSSRKKVATTAFQLWGFEVMVLHTLLQVKKGGNCNITFLFIFDA